MSLLSPPGPPAADLVPFDGSGDLPLDSMLAIVDEYVSVSGAVEEGASMLCVEDSLSQFGRMSMLGDLDGYEDGMKLRK